MGQSTISQYVARYLSQLWEFHRKPEFLKYVLGTYGIDVSNNPSFRSVYIAKADNGDIECGSIGGIISHWWIIDEDGLRAVRRPELFQEDVAIFDATPIVKFYLENKAIIVGERLGPNLLSRKRGVLSEYSEKEIISHLTVIWSSRTDGSGKEGVEKVSKSDVPGPD